MHFLKYIFIVLSSLVFVVGTNAQVPTSENIFSHSFSKALKRYYYNKDCNCGVQQGSYDSRNKNGSVLSQLTVAVRLGVAGLTYQTDLGVLKPGLNTGAELTYATYFDDVIGLRFGLNVAFSSSTFEAINYTDKYTVIDVEEDFMDVYYCINKLTEKHTQFLVEIPLQFAMRFEPISINIGPKLVIPVAKKYYETLEGIDLRCYYPAYDVEIDEALALATGQNGEIFLADDLTHMPAFWCTLSADLSYNIPLKSGNELGLGFYVDYALNTYHVPKTSNLSLLSITDTRAGVPVSRLFESVLQSNHAESGKQVVTDFGYLCAGFKLSYNIMPSSTSSTKKRR